jgi:hypothetical protein
VSLSPKLATAARSAPFVFFGTVRRPGASAVEALDREDEPTAVVRVDTVVSAPELVGDLAGKDVTVRLADKAGGSVRRGQRLLFLATSLHYGEQIAVAEIARMPARGAEASEVIGQKLQERDAALEARLREATLVIYGRVEEIEEVSAESAEEPEPLGEAKYGWRAARLLVWRALKGQPPVHPRVVFPFPRTQKWSEVPLFIKGQEGVWLLQPIGAESLAAGKRHPPSVPDGFTAFDELDFQAAGLVDRIRLLLDLGALERTAKRRR